MPETKTTETMLRVSRVIKAPREKVYQAFMDPKLVAQWYHPGDMRTEVYTWEPKKDGRFHIAMIGESGEHPGHHVARGVFTEVVPGKKLRHSFAWDSEDPEKRATGSVITIELKDVPGGTEVVLIHEMLPSKASVEAHTPGWMGCLENLEKLF